MIISEIVDGIKVVTDIIRLLQSAKTDVEGGKDITTEQRKALDDVNSLKANRLVSLIDEKLGNAAPSESADPPSDNVPSGPTD